MKTNKLMKTMAKAAERSAIECSQGPCTFFIHQPKVPAKLLKANREK